jgi:hypothetical protein
MRACCGSAEEAEKRNPRAQTGVSVPQRTRRAPKKSEKADPSKAGRKSSGPPVGMTNRDMGWGGAEWGTFWGAGALHG